MRQDQFHSWLENPALMDATTIRQLREVIKRYPYFQAAQVMLAKNLKNENHIDQLNQLQLAAVMVPDRKAFHDYLHDKKKSVPAVDLPKQDVAHEKESEQSVKEESSVNEVERESLYDLIPEPVVYQLETADLPDLPATTEQEEEEIPEPEELTFSEWLEYSQSGKATSQPTQPTVPENAKPIPSLSNIEIIDHFLTQQSEAPKKRAEFFNPQKAGAKSQEEDFTVVSETLAKIYFQQEKYDLARQSYEALRLKYPEKSVYFAARLKEIDEKLNSE
jgi:hypothetical protein